MWHGEALANTFRPRGSLQWYFLEEPGEQEGKRSDHRGRKEYRMQRARKYVKINTPDRRRQCRDCRGIGCDRQTCYRDRKSTRLNSSHYCASRMPSSAFNNKIINTQTTY